jgi:hypothetical protein
MSQGRIPSAKHVLAMKNDKPFAAFMEGVIICTEQGYDEAVLEELLKKEHKTDYKNNYVDMITKIVEELLIEGKVNKL